VDEEDEVDVVMSSSGNDWDEGAEGEGNGEVSGSIVWDELEYGQMTREAIARRREEQPGLASAVKEVTDADSATKPTAASNGRRKVRGGKRETTASTRQQRLRQQTTTSKT